MMEWFLTSSVLILVLALLRRMLRGRIGLRFQYALWAVVLLRLLIPWSPVESGISVLNVTKEPEVQAIVDSVREPIRWESQIVAVDQESGETLPVTATHFIANEEDLHHFYSPDEVSFVLWKWGCALLFGFMLTSNLVFLRKLELNRARKKVPGVTIPVYTSPVVQTPCLAGFLHPSIYLPEQNWEQTQLWYVIEHELTHYSHKDHLISVLRCVALALHWYNPLVWWAAKASKEDGELACDEGTLARLGEGERIPYGRTLLELTCTSGRNNVMLTATTMTGSKRSLKERIQRIAKGPKMTTLTACMVLVVMGFVVGCTFTGAGGIDPMDEMSDEELFEKLEQMARPEEVEQLLFWLAGRGEEKASEVWISSSQAGKGYGAMLNHSRSTELKALFSRYQWSKETGEMEATEQAKWIEVRVETVQKDHNLRILLDCCEEHPDLLTVYGFSYGEDGILTNGTEQILLRGTPKEQKTESLYDMLVDLFSRQEADEEQSREETFVEVETEEQGTAWLLEILNNCDFAMLIREHIGSPIFSFGIREREIQRLLDVMNQYEFVSDPSWNPPAEAGPGIMMSCPRVCSMIFYEAADYIYINVFPTETSQERFAMMKAVSKDEKAENLYDTVALLHQDAMEDEYFDRTSDRIANTLYEALMDKEKKGCAGEIKRWRWIEGLNMWSVNHQDIPALEMEGDGYEIAFYNDQNLVKYSTDGEIHYYFALPNEDEQGMLLEAIQRYAISGE